MDEKEFEKEYGVSHPPEDAELNEDSNVGLMLRCEKCTPVRVLMYLENYPSLAKDLLEIDETGEKTIREPLRTFLDKGREVLRLHNQEFHAVNHSP